MEIGNGLGLVSMLNETGCFEFTLFIFTTIFAPMDTHNLWKVF